MTEDYDQLKAQKDRIEHQQKLDQIRRIGESIEKMSDQLDRARALLLASLLAVHDQEKVLCEQEDPARLSLKIEAMIKELT